MCPDFADAQILKFESHSAGELVEIQNSLKLLRAEHSAVLPTTSQDEIGLALGQPRAG